MNDTLQAETRSPETPLAAYLIAREPTASVVSHRGSTIVRSASSEGSLDAELEALFHGCGLYDLGYRRRIRVTGEDRLRWLNGMLTNAVQGLPEGHWNYSLLLNAQGRIQGDCEVYRAADELLVETDASQLDQIMQHLDRFIIMDDVVLEGLDASTTAIGVAGPRAAQVLEQAGLPLPGVGQFIAQGGYTVAHAYGVLVPHFQIWFRVDELGPMLDRLTHAGAVFCGAEAAETLRVIEGIPLYGTDFLERHLPQETNQMRALNFNKGCYLGQEIVERIRSRATVHRGLRQFELSGAVPAHDAELKAGNKIVGALSSFAAYNGRSFALGFVRNEPLERGERIEYEGGAAIALDRPPSVG